MVVAGFFWVLSILLTAEGIAQAGAAWLVIGGALAIVAFLLSVLVVTRMLVKRAPRR